MMSILSHQTFILFCHFVLGIKKGIKSMAVSGFGFRKALVGIGWAISLLLCMNEVRK